MSNTLEGSAMTTVLPVYVKGGNGREVLVYALLDTQSDASFVSESLADKLGLVGSKVNLSMSTMANFVQHTTCRKFRDISVRGLFGGSPVTVAGAYSRRSIPARREHIPHRAKIARWTHLEHVLDGFADLLDVPVQMLIGYDTPMAIAPTETVEHKPGAPHVFRTALGWTAIGCSQATQRPRHVTTHRISVIEELAPGEAGFAMRTTFHEKPALPRPDAVLRALEPETGERDSDMRRSVEDNMFFSEVGARRCNRRPRSHHLAVPRRTATTRKSE